MKVGDILKIWNEISKWDQQGEGLVKVNSGEYLGVLISFGQDDDDDLGYGNIINSYGDIILVDFAEANKTLPIKHKVINETA